MSRIGELSSKIEELLFWFFHGERKTHSEVRDKLKKNEKKYPAEKVKGCNKKYNEY